MPNTNPPTANIKEFQRKIDLANNRMSCNYAYYFGATSDNDDELADLKNLECCCGIKLIEGSSTGNLFTNCLSYPKPITNIFFNFLILQSVLS